MYYSIWHNSSTRSPLRRTGVQENKTFFFFISLIADGPHHYNPACGHKGSSHLRFTPYNFLSRCKFSTLTARQPMVEIYLLTFPRFPLRKKEHKSYFGKNRTHDFRTSRCASYLLDQKDYSINNNGNSGQDYNIYIQYPK